MILPGYDNLSRRFNGFHLSDNLPSRLFVRLSPYLKRSDPDRLQTQVSTEIPPK